jgi:hypothetical protein
MGDSRANIKIELSIYGYEFEPYNASINWTVGGDIYEIDQRVIDYLVSAYLKARAKYDESMRGDHVARERVETERKERAEYERLKAKFEHNFDEDE